MNPIPTPYKILATALLVLGLVAAGWAAYNHAFDAGLASGSAQVQARWDADRLEMAREMAMEREHQVHVTQVVETRYIERVRVIHDSSETLIKKVPEYVSSDDPDLPGGFRLLHDAAALGGPIPDPADGAHAAAVPAQVLAVTVAENYARCRANAEALTAWQEWARAQAAATPRSQEQGSP